MIWLPTLVALAADEPCYGHSWPDRVEGEHVWVEWQEGLVNDAAAEVILGTVEDAWTTYEQDGWTMPPPSVVLSIEQPVFGSAAARCITELCGDVPMPIIELYPYGIASTSHVVPHELGHAVQYAYMGSYTQSISTWMWWMEGSATWMSMRAAPDTDDWAWAIRDYVGRPHLALHHDPTAMVDADVTPHLYGTAAVALYLEEAWGGPDAVRSTWEIGAASSGEPVWFPDVVEEMGIDWPTFWTGFLGTIPTVAFERGAEIPSATALARVVGSLPTDSAGVDESLRPENLGFSVVRFDAGAGGRNKALYVELRPEAGVTWHAVLARTDGIAPGSRVREVVSLQAGEGGVRYGWMSGYDGAHPVFLVVSPDEGGWDPTDDPKAWDYAWSAELIRDPGPMEPGDGPPGCAHSRGGPWWLLALLALGRRRQAW